VITPVHAPEHFVAAGALVDAMVDVLRRCAKTSAVGANILSNKKVTKSFRKIVGLFIAFLGLNSSLFNA